MARSEERTIAGEDTPRGTMRRHGVARGTNNSVACDSLDDVGSAMNGHALVCSRMGCRDALVSSGMVSVQFEWSHVCGYLKSSFGDL